VLRRSGAEHGAHGPRAYATAPVDTLDFLSERSVGAPLVATAASSPASLARRIKMLKNHASVVRLTLGRLAVLSAIVALPMAIAFAAKPPQAEDHSRSGKQKLGAQRAVEKRMANRRTAMRDCLVAYPFSFIQDPEVRKRLNLSSQQERELEEISADYPAEWQEFLAEQQSLSPQERTKRQAELREKPRAAAQVLTSQQQTILENAKLRKWLEVMLQPQMSEKLGLTEDQRRQLGRLRDEVDATWRKSPADITDRWVFEKEKAMHETIGEGKEEEFLAALGVPGMSGRAAAAKERERWLRTTWRMNIGLDAPGLRHEAVQWAIFDEDPVPDFQARVERMQSYYRKRIEEAADADAKEMQRSVGMSVSWDLGFKKITGDQLYLLTAGGPHGISSNGPDGKKWIVTKTVRIDGKAACWCIPVEVKTGQSIDVWLEEDNLFDLNTAFNEALWAPDPAK
jgi:hypothetical protein